MKKTALFATLLTTVFTLFFASAAFGPVTAVTPENQYIMQNGKAATAEFSANYLVDFSCSGAQFSRLVASLNGTIESIYPKVGVASVTGLTDSGAKSLEKANGINTVVQDMHVQWVPGTRVIAADQMVNADFTGDPESAGYYGYQWNMWQIDAPAAWDEELGDPGVRVAVLDSGISPNHPDLVGKYVMATSFVPSNGVDIEGDPTDNNFHGTHVAAIISSNCYGVASVAPNVSLVGVKVLDYDGSGNFSWIISGIIYAVDVADADVINMSIGGYFPKSASGTSKLHSVLTKVINYAFTNDVFVVASAGNESYNLDLIQDYIHVPSEAGNCFSVGATGPVGWTNFDNLASYSNYGHSGVDVVAPGGDFQLYPQTGWYYDMVLSASPTGWAFAAGTSQAAPHASGIAALVKSRYPNIRSGHLRALLRTTCDDLGAPGVDLYYSHGRMNAYNAITR